MSVSEKQQNILKFREFFGFYKILRIGIFRGKMDRNRQKRTEYKGKLY